jgi:hypothetical protein
MRNASLAKEDLHESSYNNSQGQDATGTVAAGQDPVSPHTTTDISNESGQIKPSSAYVWIGSSTDNGSSRVDNLEEEGLASRDGIGIVYVSSHPPYSRHWLPIEPVSLCVF